jgi:hypothetical protein
MWATTDHNDEDDDVVETREQPFLDEESFNNCVFVALEELSVCADFVACRDPQEKPRSIHLPRLSDHFNCNLKKEDFVTDEQLDEMFTMGEFVTCQDPFELAKKSKEMVPTADYKKNHAKIVVVSTAEYTAERKPLIVLEEPMSDVHPDGDSRTSSMIVSARPHTRMRSIPEGNNHEEESSQELSGVLLTKTVREMTDSDTVMAHLGGRTGANLDDDSNLTNRAVCSVINVVNMSRSNPTVPVE